MSSTTLQLSKRSARRIAVAPQLPYGSAMIRTRANLKFYVLADIMHSIGCNTDRREVYRMTIDGRLLRHRNDVAHGREESVTLEDWRDIRDRVVIVLKDVRTQISNAAASETFKQTNSITHTADAWKLPIKGCRSLTT
jgi:MAE_28990/MAE_18760-like HEPN